MSALATPRAALSDRTNAAWSLPTPPDSERSLKRRVSTEVSGNKKRVKLENTKANEDDNNDIEIPDASSCYGESVRFVRQNCSTFSRLHASRMQRRQPFQNALISSLPILTSFVSSHKSDVYNLHSQDDPIAPDSPWACAFTSDAKRGGIPVLAVATQEGTVELLNVSKRQDWDFEPQRTSVQVHTSAILDLKWGFDDQYIATSSGDSTTRVTSARTQQCFAVLAHHTSSVKTLDWDPSHADLLSTASRDGSICVWDLRANSRQYVGEASPKLSPVLVIPHAHCDIRPRVKSLWSSKTVTSLAYLPQNPRQLISSGSFNGVLKQWDLRYPVTGWAKRPIVLSESFADPTVISGSRARGISSLALGQNHSAGLMWGVSVDSCIHTYTLPLSAPFAQSAAENRLTHPGLFVNSFYVRVAVSPCGEWLASGSTNGGVYLWDVGTRQPGQRRAVELKAAEREIGAVDWAKNCLAACCDDGSVRIWRPDLEVSAACEDEPEDKKWDWAWASEDL